MRFVFRFWVSALSFVWCWLVVGFVGQFLVVLVFNFRCLYVQIDSSVQYGVCCARLFISGFVFFLWKFVGFNLVGVVVIWFCIWMMFFLGLCFLGLFLFRCLSSAVFCCVVLNISCGARERKIVLSRGNSFGVYSAQGFRGLVLIFLFLGWMERFVDWRWFRFFVSGGLLVGVRCFRCVVWMLSRQGLFFFVWYFFRWGQGQRFRLYYFRVNFKIQFFLFQVIQI